MCGGGGVRGWRGRELNYIKFHNSHQLEQKAVSMLLQVALLRKLCWEKFSEKIFHLSNAGFKKSC